MHHVTGKARRTRRFEPTDACESCREYQIDGCDKGRSCWPDAGRRCKDWRLDGELPTLAMRELRA